MVLVTISNVKGRRFKFIVRDARLYSFDNLMRMNPSNLKAAYLMHNGRAIRSFKAV